MTATPDTGDRRPGRRGLSTGIRALLVVVIAAALVVAIALVIRATAEDPTATTGAPAVGRTSSTLPVLPAEGRVEPSKEQWEELLPALEEAAAAAPDDTDAQESLALAYYNLGRYTEAVTIYERLLATDDDATRRTHLGNALRDMGDTAGAEEAYRAAIVGDPALVAPYLDLAELLWRRGDDAEALAVIDQGLEAVSADDRAALEAGRDAMGE